MAEPIALNSWQDMRLWLCPLREAPLERELFWLDSTERTRAARFVHEDRRRRWRAAHVALRRVLGQHLGQTPESLQFSHDANGKPQLMGCPGWHFNLSDSEDWALIGMQKGTPIGVDIEVRRGLDSALALACRLYTPAEQAAVKAASEGAERDDVFLRVWTRKEACLKAVGLGLRLAPNSFEVGATDTDVVVRLRTPDGAVDVQVVSLPTGIQAHAAAARVMSVG